MESPTDIALSGSLRLLARLRNWRSPFWRRVQSRIGARGIFDTIEMNDGLLIATGWLFTPGCVIDHVRLVAAPIPSTFLVTVEKRLDVLRVFRRFPESLWSGFTVRTAIEPIVPDAWQVLRAVGLSRGNEVGSVGGVYRCGARNGLPEPPPALRYRVTRCESSSAYWAGGVQTFWGFWKAMQRHGVAAPSLRILDWGCGCGRVTGFLSKYLDRSWEIHGCDIDAEAIDWCERNLPELRFSVVPPHPPTPYESGFFQVIVSYSVFTHLAREVQREWLREMHRILAPGGVLLASVHGEFAGFFAHRRIRREMAREGISDSRKDPILARIAPKDYYRGVYQSRDYTLRHWQEYFTIEEYLEQGMHNVQDLVVLRRK